MRACVCVFVCASDKLKIMQYFQIFLMKLQTPQAIQSTVENVIVNGDVEQSTDEIIDEPIQETIVETVEETVEETAEESVEETPSIQPEEENQSVNEPAEVQISPQKVVVVETTTTTTAQSASTSTIPNAVVASVNETKQATVVPEVPKVAEAKTPSKVPANDSSFILTPDYIQQSKFF